MFMNFNSFFSFWILIEVNMVVFLVVMAQFSNENSEENVFLNPCLYYFMCQSASSLVFIFLSLVNHDELYSFIMATICICLKMGIFPFYFWSVYLSDFMDEITFYFFLTFQKIPLIIYLFSVQNDFALLFILPNLLLGTYLMYISKKINYLLLSSSIYSITWLFLIWFSSIYMFILFFLSYCTHMFYATKINSNHLSKVFKMSFLMMVFLMFLCGLPPFNLFFFKYYSIFLFFIKNSLCIFSLIWIFSFICTIVYFKKFFLMIFSFKKFYNFFSLKFNKVYLFLPTLYFFF